MSAQTVSPATLLMVCDQLRKSCALQDLNDPRVLGRLHCVCVFHYDM